MGDGVVGQQPRLEAGEAFEYTSFCILKTPHGSMRGAYRMVRADGTSFEARIAPFAGLIETSAAAGSFFSFSVCEIASCAARWNAGLIVV